MATQILPAEESDGVANDGVIGWISVDIEHPNEGSGTSFDTNFAARQVTIAADELINFSLYDENGERYFHHTQLAHLRTLLSSDRNCCFL